MTAPWYMLPDADPDRPMTPDEAAEWLRLRELGYSDGAGTLRRWAADGTIGKLKIGDKVAFTLRLLRFILSGNMVEELQTGRPINDGNSSIKWVLGGALVRERQAKNLDIRSRGKRSRSRGAAAVAATAQSRNFRDDTPIPFPELPNGTGDF